VQPSGCAEESSFEEVEFGAAVYLAFDEFEFRDLTFGLTVRPRLRERRVD
jgi:hypothetical protein